MATIGQIIAAAAGNRYGMPASYSDPSKWGNVYPSMTAGYAPEGGLEGAVGQSTLQRLQKMGQFSSAASKVDPVYAAYQWRTDPSQINSRYQSQYRNFLDQLQNMWAYDQNARAALEKAGFYSPWVPFEEYLRATDAVNDPIAQQMYAGSLQGTSRISQLLGNSQQNTSTVPWQYAIRK